MQVSSIGPNFKGRRDNIDAFIGMDDNTIRQLAYLQTSDKINRNRNKKITNALFYSAPLCAGLGVAMLSKNGNNKMFSTQLTGVAGRMAKGLKIAALWTAALGAVDLLGFAKNKLNQNVPEAKKFDREHPLMSMGLLLAAGFGAIALVTKGATKLGGVQAPKFLQKATNKVADFLNNSNIMVKTKEGLLKLSKNTPSALKEIGATALDWAPTALLFGGLFHSIASTNAENREFAKNYTKLRDAQANVTLARVNELAMENDLLMQDANNKETINLVEDCLDNASADIAE